jgi:hypothetical protein
MFTVLRQNEATLNEAIDKLSKIFNYMFAGDMLITFDRNMSFFEDARFMQAFQSAALTELERTLIWRVHVLCWCAQLGLRRAGDFVECGVFRGFFTAVAARYLDFGSRDRHWYLYDTFTGIPADQLDPGHENPAVFQETGLYEACRERFAGYANVDVVRGRIPEVLRERAPEKVAFLHLDLNSAAAETGALEFFWERLAPGAPVLLDDYGWRAYRAQKLAEDPFFAARDRQVLELPTGQGLVIA